MHTTEFCNKNVPCNPIMALNNRATTRDANCYCTAASIKSISTNNFKFSHLKNINSAQIELTIKCNLQCIHCYAQSKNYKNNKKTKELDLVSWTKSLELLASKGCKSVQFTGGEPTLSPHLSKLIETASLLGFCNINIFSNGLELNHMLLETIISHKASYSSSIYGPTSTEHDTITQRQGSFYRTMKSLITIKKLGIDCSVGIIKFNENQTKIGSIISMLKSNELDNYYIDNVRPIGRWHARSGNSVNFVTNINTHSHICLTCEGNITPCAMNRNDILGNILEFV